LLFRGKNTTLCLTYRVIMKLPTILFASWSKTFGIKRPKLIFYLEQWTLQHSVSKSQNLWHTVDELN
jgi:hypothetical protein